MKITVCLLIAYLLGSLSPAALISKLKRTDLREHGTKNLGATNTMLVFGKLPGAAVMLFDIAKAFLAVRCAEWIAPGLSWLPMASGLTAVVGHCFPFYLRFQGGKGLAAFAGVVLAYRPSLFLFLLVTGLLLMILINHSFALPLYATVFFTVFVCVQEKSLATCALAAGVSLLIIVMHFGNLIKALRGCDLNIREYIKTKLFHKDNAA